MSGQRIYIAGTHGKAKDHAFSTLELAMQWHEGERDNEAAPPLQWTCVLEDFGPDVICHAVDDDRQEQVYITSAVVDEFAEGWDANNDEDDADGDQ